MSRVATFLIEINGVKESIDGIQSINKQLDDLEKRLDVISKKNITVSVSGGVAEGLGRVTIKVGETERQFKSASAAARTLKNELNGLSIEGKRGTKEWEEVKQALTETQTAIQGTSVGMQRLMDTMQSFVAIASVSKGLGALFGIDDSEIQKSIQQLMALQTALNGLQTLNKQITNQKGIGYWLAQSNKMVDTFAAGLLKAEKNAKILASGLKMLGAGAIIAGITALVVIFNKFQKSQEEARKAFERNLDIMKTGAEAYRKAEIELNGYIKKLDEFKGSKKAEKQLIDEVSKKYDIYNKNIKNVKDMKALLIKMAPTYLETIKEEAKMTALAAESAKLYAENIALIAKRDKLQTEYNNLNWNERMSGYGVALKKQLKDINTEIDANTKSMDVFNKELDKSAKIVSKNKAALAEMGVGDGKDREKKVKDNSKKIEDAVRQAENNINALRLRLMNDGLLKQLMQLDDNNRKEIAAIKKNGQLVEEQLKLQSQVYNKERKKIIDDYIKNINESIKGLNLKILEDDIVEVQNLNEVLKESKTLMMDFSDSEGVRNSLAKMAKDLGEAWKTMDFDKAINFEGLRLDANATKQFDDYFKFLLGYLKEQGEEVQKAYLDIFDKAYEEALKTGYSDEAATKTAQLKMFEELEAFFKNTYQYEMKLIDKYGVNVMEAILGGNDGEVLEISLQQRLDTIDHYYNTIGNRILSNIREIEAKRKELLDKQELDELEKAGKDRDKQLQNPDEAISKDDYKTILETNTKVLEEYEKKRAEITLRYANERKKLEIDTARDISLEYSEYYDKMLTSYMDFQSTLNNLVGKQPVMNSWEIVNIGKTKKQLKEAENAVKAFKENITAQLSSLEKNYADGLITPEVYTSTKRRLMDIETSVDETSEQIQDKMKRLPADFMQSIQQYVQAVGQAATSIIQSISEINNAALQNEIDAIDKQTELLQDALDKQKEITQKHADDVNDIEDELASARGDRRQFLIDQLNAEMQAQRESLAQEKRMEKEKEALDKKRDDLEFQQKMNQWNASKLTAMINAALAISAAAVNTYPIPAVPMMALAASVGAAQVAAVMAAKPKRYASGGLLEGPDHKHGGIPVGNSGIEVEGKEYVIRKESSIPNLDLLSYINRKKRKLSLDDFIDFYSKNSIKGSIEKVRPKYANGGQLPTLRNDIDINNRLITAIDDFANKPTYVEVVDIINKADNVRQVRALSGLKQN